MRLRRRTIGTLFAAVAVAVLAAPAAASARPARAGTGFPVGDGTGWSWSYQYSSPDQLYISGGVRGAQISIGASDVNGDRTLYPLLIDNVGTDGFCAGLAIFSNGNPVMNRMFACDTTAFAATPTFHGDITIVPFLTRPGDTSIEGSYYLMTIPNFDDDPGLRSAGTGFSWHYNDSSNFDFDMVVPGAHVTGNGWTDGPETRAAQFTIWWTGADSCVQASIDSETDPGPPGGNIGVACPFGSGYGWRGGMANYLDLHTFSGPHSLIGAIALPNSGPH